MPAHRKNGSGGARKGAGRKRDTLPSASLQRIGPRPENQPLKLARWYAELLSEILDQFIRTGKYVEMYREVRAGATAIRNVMPIDLVLAANRKLKDDEEDLKEDDVVEEEVREIDGRSSRAVRRNTP